MFWTTREEADCTRTDKLAAVSSSNFTVISLNTGGFFEVSFEVVAVGVVVVVVVVSFDFPKSNLSNELNSLLLLFVLSSSSPLAAADNKRRKRRRRHRETTRAGEQKRDDDVDDVVVAIIFPQTTTPVVEKEKSGDLTPTDHQKKGQKYLSKKLQFEFENLHCSKNTS